MPHAVVWAVCGSLAIQLLSLIELRNVPKASRPDFRDLFYWLPFIVAPILGGGLVYAYDQGNTPLTPILSAHIGISAPLILRSMSDANPFRSGTINPGPGA